MSLVGTLGRIAVGVALAKGVGGMMGRGGSGGGLGGLLGNVLGGSAGSQQTGGSMSNMGSTGGSAGGLGGLAGGLGSLLGGQGGGAGASGGLGGLLESMAGGASGAATGGSAETAPIGGSLGDLLNNSLQGNKIPEPAPAQEEQARILIQAMVNAAKCDGQIDQQEQQKIVEHLGEEVSDEERQFVISEMQSPLDTEGFIRSIPRGAETQVYMMSLLGINLDSREEAQYLDTLRKGINMSEDQCNAVHEKLGVPTLYG